MIGNYTVLNGLRQLMTLDEKEAENALPLCSLCLNEIKKRLREGAFTRETGEVDLPAIEEEEEFEIRVKKFPIKPMSPEEAILQMNLSGHSFYMFRNSDSGDINVVYAKHDGNYGMIIPEV